MRRTGCAIFMAVCLTLHAAVPAMAVELPEAEMVTAGELSEMVIEEGETETATDGTQSELSVETDFGAVRVEEMEEVGGEEIAESGEALQGEEAVEAVKGEETVEGGEAVEGGAAVAGTEVVEGAGEIQPETRNLYAEANAFGLRVELTQPESELRCNVPVTFTMTPVNGSGAMGDIVQFDGKDKPRYMYLVNTVMRKDEATGGYTSVVDPTRYSYVQDNQFSFTFTASGDYYIVGRVMDFGGTSIKIASKEFRFKISDDAAPTLNEVADGIVKDCLAAGCKTDYEKALYFHDWIINHAVYDDSYTYMDAEGVLIRGKGTCESYYRALALLLGKVGIPSERAEGNGHVWSCVRLDGEWTQIDATWNGGSYSGDLNYMRHLYFGVTDEMIKKAHSNHKPVESRPCTSYERNYFIRSGEISRWTDPVEASIREKLAAGETTFTIAAERNSYPNVYHIIYPMAAWSLDQKLRAESLCTVEYDSAGKCFAVKPIPVSGGTDAGTGGSGTDTGNESGGTDAGTGGSDTDTGNESGGTDAGSSGSGTNTGNESGGTDAGTGGSGTETGNESGGTDAGTGGSGTDTGNENGGTDAGTGGSGTSTGTGTGNTGGSTNAGNSGSSTGTGTSNSGSTGSGTGAAGNNTAGSTSGSANPCAASHTFSGNWVRVAAPSCVSEGKMRRSCSVCGTAEERVIPRTGHSVSWALAGGMKRAVCTSCNTVLSEQKVEVSLNASTLPLQVKRSTKALQVSAKDGMDEIAFWSSSNQKIVRVDARTGKLTAKKAGKAYVTVTMKSGASARCLIKVQKKKVAVSKLKVSASTVYLSKGQKLTLQAVVTPLTATDKVKYTSSKKKVATVSAKGVITAKKKGTAKITVKAGSKKKTVKVIVR